MSHSFKPRDADFAAKVTASFGRQEIMKTLGVTIASIEPGVVELEFPFAECLTQQHGFVHAGIVSTVLDSACGYAAFSLMSKEAAVLTVEFKVNLLSPAKGDRFRAVGRVKKSGRTISVAEGELFALIGGEQKLVATMVGTILSVYGREEIQS